MVEPRRLLQLAGAHDGPPDEAAIAALCDEVRRLARGFVSGARSARTIAPTALADEAWLRLFGCAPMPGNGPQFFAAAATTLRRVFVERSRRCVQQHGAGLLRRDIELEARLLALDDGLAGLASFEPAKATLVELRFYCGLSVAEAARGLGVSERTAAREWRVARAYLLAGFGEVAWEPERRLEIQTIFLDAARERPPDRAAFLTSACDGDSELRAVVGMMLAADACGDALLDGGAIGLLRHHDVMLPARDRRALRRRARGRALKGCPRRRGRA